MKLSKKAIILAGFAFLFVMSATPVLAQTFDFGVSYGGQLGFGTREFRSAIMSIVNILMGFLGIVALIVMLLGGFFWMTAGGNEDRIAQGRGYIVAGLIGLVIIFASYALIIFVINSMLSATDSTSTFS